MASRNSFIARGAALALIAATLPGCLPLGAPTIIGLGLDGLSFAATGKTITDHAISGLAQRDCSVGRAVLTGTQLCKGEPAATVLMAEDHAPAPTAPPVELAAVIPPADNPLHNSEHPSRWPQLQPIQ